MQVLLECQRLAPLGVMKRLRELAVAHRKVQSGPADVESIENGMRRVLDDPGLAEALRQKGFRRAREFSWERSVEKTQRVYQEVASDGRAAEMEHQAG